MSTKVIHIPSRVFDGAKRAGILFLVCILIGGLITFFSPSVTLSLDSEDRLEFWLYLCLIGGVGIFLSDLALEYWADNWPKAVRAFISSLCGAGIVLIAVFWVYEPEDLPSVGVTIFFVWAIMVLIVAGKLLLTRDSITVESQDIDSGETTNTPALLARLPVYLQQAELYALSAEDHYVRVHTSKGAELLLMRLSDSIAEAMTVSGQQTHRSWWVAKAAVVNIKKSGRTAEITLKDGTIVPVSRNGLKTIKDKGWL